MKNGFSLIELLISLIIISLIATALAPILTRGIKHRQITLGSGGNSTACKKFDALNRCLICSNEGCSFCSTQLNLAQGQFVDSKTSCDIKTCPDGCLKCDKNGCLECKESFGFNSANKTCHKCPSGKYAPSSIQDCVLCPEGYYCKDGQKYKCLDNCLSCLSESQCTKCDKNFTLKDGKCNKDEAECYFVEYLNICIAKYNAGDPKGLKIPEGLVTLKTTTPTSQAAGTHTQAICYIGGNTGNPCSSLNGGYSGCNRVGCTFYAAEKICRYYGQRLPTEEELASFAAYSIGKGEDGLQLCDQKSGSLSPRCNESYVCPGSNDGNADIFRVWSSNQTYYNLSNNNWTKGKTTTSEVYSVRCIKDM